MATTSSINLSYTTQSGRKGQKSITDINPAASGEQLQEFAERLNALTTNVYGNTNRVDKTPITNAEEPPVRVATTIVCYQSSAYTRATTDEGVEPTATAQEIALSAPTSSILKTNTDALPYVISQPEGAAIVFSKFTNEEANTIEGVKNAASWRTDLSYAVVVTYYGSSLAGEYVIGFPETENFKAATYTITVTAS